MAACALQQISALYDLSNTVIKQQRSWLDALQPNIAVSHLHNTEAEKPVPKNGGILYCGGEPVKLCGPGQWSDPAPFSGGSYTSERITKRERQEFLWQDFFLDPRLWWDNRQDKRSSRHPDFRHKISKQALWLDNVYKPAWVDSQLAVWDAQLTDRTTPASIPLEEGQLLEVVGALELVVQRGCYIDKAFFYRVLKRCIDEKDIVLGRRIHGITVRWGHGSDAFWANHLIRMYASHGSLKEAMHVFTEVPAPDTYMWASMISAYSEHGQHDQAINLYRKMRESAVKPNSYVFVAVLKTCIRASDFTTGKEVHNDIQDSGGEGEDVFVGSCLVDMYVKCGRLEEARKVFERLPKKNVVTWTAMISGYAQNGLGQEALALYAGMLEDGLTPADRVAFVCLLQACASIGALHQGKQLHSLIREKGLEADVAVGNSLVDMYAKCGRLEEARRVFDRLMTRDVVTWTALLNGYAEHGEAQMAIRCFEEMQQEGVDPDEVTFSSLLVACSHEGLVTEGERYFSMMQTHSITPSVYHYDCMVDLLARSGRLEEAENMLRIMPFENDVVGWTALLSACKSHGDINRGRLCFDRLIALQPENAAAYVLLANIYANAGRWKDVDEIESLRKSAGAWKKPGKACIEVKNKLHEFVVGEERGDISKQLKNMNLRLLEGGHVPHTELVLKAVSEREKEDALCGHAEKLALAYGLLHTSDGTPLLVTKNLRMCNDCHSSTKIMSHLEKREIVVRDAHRVHRFLDGSCSCKDQH